MKAEKRLLHLCSFQLLCSLYIQWKKQNLGVGGGGGEGQEQRDWRAKF